MLENPGNTTLSLNTALGGQAGMGATTRDEEYFLLRLYCIVFIVRYSAFNAIVVLLNVVSGWFVAIQFSKNLSKSFR